jgi:hypothetical protein
MGDLSIPLVVFLITQRSVVTMLPCSIIDVQCGGSSTCTPYDEMSTKSNYRAKLRENPDLSNWKLYLFPC